MSNAGAMNPTAVEITSNYTQLFGYKDNIMYSGLADPGTLPSEPKWRIQERLHSDNGQLLSVKFAEGQTAFNYVWDDRESLIYK
jgi:hypothetical protein